MASTKHQYLQNVDIRRQILRSLPYSELLNIIQGLVADKDYSLAEAISSDIVYWSEKAERDFGVPIPLFMKKISTNKSAIFVYDEYRITYETSKVLREMWLMGRNMAIFPNREKVIENYLYIIMTYNTTTPTLKETLNKLPSNTFKIVEPSTELLSNEIIIDTPYLGQNKFIFNDNKKLMDIVRKHGNLYLQDIVHDDGIVLFNSAGILLSYLGYTMGSVQKGSLLTVMK